MHQDAGSQATAWQTDRLCPMLFQGHEHAGVRARPRKPFQEGEQGRLLRGGGWILHWHLPDEQRQRGGNASRAEEKGESEQEQEPRGRGEPAPAPTLPPRQPAGRWGPRKGKGEAGTPRRPGRVGVSWGEFCILEGDVS